jgi:CheY-like chemotaxis protein
MMIGQMLRGRHILIVEDEYLLADDLRSQFEDAGAIVLGPAGTLGGAFDLIASEPRIDGAVLDANLHGEMVFPAADLLVGRSIPFVFTTGYDASTIPSRFEHVARCEKPVKTREVTDAIIALLEVRAFNEPSLR